MQNHFTIERHRNTELFQIKATKRVEKERIEVNNPFLLLLLFNIERIICSKDLSKRIIIIIIII